MREDDTSTATPRLRFPEFHNAWVTKPLDAIAKPTTERAGSRPITPYTVTTGVGLVSQQERFGRTIAGSAFKNYYAIKRDDFAYNKSATKAYPQGYIARFLSDEGAVPNSIFTCFRADPNDVSPVYLDYLFAGNLHGRWLKRFIEVSARAHGSLSINDADLMALPVPLPEGSSSLAEQRKIADCLTSLDEAIAAQGRKVAALADHKRGLMQQLFPREGETVPRLRFPEYLAKPAWAEKTIGECGNTLSGLSGKAGSDFGAGEPFVTYKQVFDSPVIDRSQCGRVGIAENERQTRLQYGDVLITTSSETPGEVGWASILLDTSDQPVYLNSFCFAFRIFDALALTPAFARYLFHSPNYRRAVGVLAQGSTRFNISKIAFLKIDLRIPIDAREQEAIAACLSTLDARIAAESEKIVALKSHKSGLLQQLFPPFEG